MNSHYKYNNHAAVVIIKLGCDKYIFQKKSKDYPIKKFAGKLCPFGGNWTEAGDKTPLDTLIRELNEEFCGNQNRPFLEELTDNVIPFSEYKIYVPSSITKRGDMLLTTTVFESQIDSKYSLTANEGEVEIISLASLKKKKFCWGYDKVFNDYLNQQIVVPAKKIKVARLDIPPLTPYTKRKLSEYRINPHREKLASERKVLG